MKEGRITRASARRVLVVEDHPLCAMAITAALSSDRHAIEVVSIGALRELGRVAGSKDFALVLLDLRLPDAFGLSAIEAVRAALPETPICIVSGQNDPSTVRQALAHGIVGFLPKSLSYEDLSRGIEKLLAGERAFPRGMDAVEDGIGPLSAAEQRVMQALSLGLQNKQIAFELGLSESTIKSHLAHIFAKLGVTNRSQAILAYDFTADDHDMNGLGMDGGGLGANGGA